MADYHMKQKMLQNMGQRNYGQRPDGTNKGLGWRGAIPLPDGRDATEMSIGVNIDGKEILIPLITPDTTDEEVNMMLQAGDPKNIPPALIDKAIDHAMKQIGQGASPFKE